MKSPKGTFQKFKKMRREKENGNMKVVYSIKALMTYCNFNSR